MNDINEIPQAAPVSNLQLLQMTMNSNLDIDKRSELIAFIERSQTKAAKDSFGRALARVQSAVPRIAPDLANPSTKSKYAGYPRLDAILRPIYTNEGFSLSFDTGHKDADTVIIQCAVSHSDGHTQVYSVPVPCDGKGPKGGEVMTRTHAMGSAISYGMRYLLKMIFNLAIGDIDDDDGNSASILPGIKEMLACQSMDSLSAAYRKAFKTAQDLRDPKLLKILTAAKDSRKKELQDANTP